MNEKEIQNNEEIEINLRQILQAVMDRAWLVALVAVLCAALAFAGTLFLITPQYKSSAMFYVNNNSFSVGDASLSITSGDLVTSRGLVDSYIVILNTRETLNEVIEYAGSDRTYGELKGMISAEAVNETEIFKVSVTSPDPLETEQIANAIAEILPHRIGTIIDGTSAKVVDSAVIPSSPSSPSYSTNTVIGFMLGFILTVGVIALCEMFDTTIHSEDDIMQTCTHPILAAVPDMAAPGKGSSYYYGYGDSRKKKKGGAYSAKQVKRKHEIMGAGVSFAASEAYKLLRTKLQFSFADDNNCRVIGLSSALSGEGKSLTSVNLAYTLSELNKKVILVDCDMRRPTLAEKLNVQKKPGLSSFLTGQCSLEELIQNCNLRGSEGAFSVISAGQNPPNPVELLSSDRMKRALAILRENYDYVILDLPPVGEVTDAMAVANDTDGMLLIVRQNYCDRIALSETVRQFAFINSKILGMVFNCTGEHGGNYGKGYYKRYYRRHYGRYYGRYSKNRGVSYESNDRSVAAVGSNKTEA